MPSFLDRFSEPSTYAGISAALGAAGVSIPSAEWKTLVLAGCGICAVASIVLKEGWKNALTTGDALSALEKRVSEVEKK